MKIQTEVSRAVSVNNCSRVTFLGSFTGLLSQFGHSTAVGYQSTANVGQ